MTVAIRRLCMPFFAGLCAAPSMAQAADATVIGGTILSTLMLVAGILLAAWAYQQAARSRTFFENVLKSLPFPAQILDRSRESVLTNQAFTELFGGDSRPAPDLIYELAADSESRAEVKRLTESAEQGLFDEALLPFRLTASAKGEAPSGPHTEWYKVTTQPVAGQPGHGLWIVELLDADRAMELAVQEERKSSLVLLDSAQLGFVALDAEGRVVGSNRTFAEWLGVSRAELTEAHKTLGEHTADKRSAERLLQAVEEANRTPVEIRFKNPDSGTFVAELIAAPRLDGTQKVVGSTVLVRNVTLGRTTQASVARLEKRLESFFEQAPVGMALVDDHGRVAECNETVRSLTGLDSETLIGKRLVELVNEESQPLVEEILKRASLTESGTGIGPSIEVRLTGEGETVCALFVTRIEEMAGGHSGYIAHFIDTSEQKSLEIQFAQSQKMQAVGQLAGGIAHDFNNLLTAMIGFSDLLLLRHPPGDQSFADIMQVKQNANRAANLVRQLLAFSRQQTLRPAIINVTDALAELSHLLQRLIGENIELKLTHGRDLGTVKADQGQLEQVIINLAVNARDAMTGGGTLTIRTKNVEFEHDTKRKGETLPAGAYTLIEVSDTGEGVPREILDRIFDPFFTTKEVGAGTGLGLSTVYGIVKQTGGFVFVESRVGHGTSFYIYLPHYAETPEEVAQKEAVIESSRDLTGIGTLMLVEDEDAVRAFSARALRNKGYQVLEAHSGEAALELLRGEEEPIDLLITDVVMPKIDGPTLVREVRGERPKLKVIFISGYAEDAFRKRLDQDAGIHFLPKPFTLKQLAGKVKEVMGEDAA
ncbi:MAG: PAS domain S-box protein [Pseudomonadota bacterium]